ncbi:MAG: thiamine pyrophosphate-binding protein [Thaumarchaeota archaeon]|nr:thiamine pyrophosphate-binding protein [Nitrososphaerota archaeon]
MIMITGGEAVVRTLKEQGVECLFGAGGSAYAAIQDSLISHREIPYYLCLNEMCTASMAEGYARATGKPGVALVHVAVGAANAVGPMFVAHRDKTPLMVIVGEQHSQHLGRKSYNEAPALIEMPRQFVKLSRQVQRPDRIPEEITRAFKVALSPPTGPVFLSIPEDYLTAEVESGIPEAERYRVMSGFGPNPQAVKEAAKTLSKAQRPFIVMGRGVAQSRASDEVVKLAEMVGAPIFAEKNGYLIDFPTTHELYFGDFNPAHPLIRNADIMLGLGGRTEIEMRYSSEPLLRSDLKIIEMHSDPEEIALIHPADIGIFCDPKQGLIELIRQLGTRRAASSLRSRMTTLRACKQSFEGEVDRRVKETWDNVPLKLGRFMKELAGLIDRKNTVVIGHGSGVQLVRHLLKPWTIFMQNGAGYLGWMLSAALGVKLGMPSKEVLAVVGDGNLMFGPQALWTAAKYNIAVKIIVLNNGFYLSEITRKNLQTRNFLGTDIGEPPIDFVQLANSMKVPAETVQKPRDIRRALRNALSHQGPYLLNLVVDNENPNRIMQDAIKKL